MTSIELFRDGTFLEIVILHAVSFDPVFIRYKVAERSVTWQTMPLLLAIATRPQPA